MLIQELEREALAAAATKQIDTQLILTNSWGHFLRLVWSKLRTSLVLKLLFRAFILVEIFVLHRFFGLQGSGLIGSLIFTEYLILEALEPIILSWRTQLSETTGISARRNLVFSFLPYLAGISFFVALPIVTLFIATGAFAGLVPLLCALLFLTPLRVCALALQQTATLTLGWQLPLVISFLFRILPIVMVLFLAPTLGYLSFSIGFVIARLIPDTTIVWRNRHIWIRLNQKRISLLRQSWQRASSRARPIIFLVAPYGLFQIAAVAILALRNSGDLLTFVAVTNLINLTLFVNSQLAKFPIKTFSRFSRASTKDTYSVLIQRWNLIYWTCLLIPVIALGFLGAKFLPYLILLTPHLLPLCVPMLVLHLTRGWYRKGLAEKIGIIDTPPAWTLNSIIFGSVGGAALFIFGTNDRASAVLLVWLEVLVLSAVIGFGKLWRFVERFRPIQTDTLCQTTRSICVVVRNTTVGKYSCTAAIDAITRGLAPQLRVEEVVSGMLVISGPAALIDPDRLLVEFAASVAAVFALPASEETLLAALKKARRSSELSPALRVMLRDGAAPEASVSDHAKPAGDEPDSLAQLIGGLSGGRCSVNSERELYRGGGTISNELRIETLKRISRSPIGRPLCTIDCRGSVFFQVGDEAVLLSETQPAQLVASGSSEFRALLGPLSRAAILYSFQRYKR